MQALNHLCATEVNALSLPAFVFLVFIIILILGIVTYRLVRKHEPAFTHLEVIKTLRFIDSKAQMAALSTRLRSKVNHTGTTQMWFRNISADGSIKNILLNGLAPDEIYEKAGSLEVCKVFEKPLRAGDVISIELSYELDNSFPGAKEGMTHVTSTKTQVLKMEIHFDPARKPLKIRAFVEFGGTEETNLPTPNFSAEGTIANLEVKNPKLGAFYTLEWDW